MPASGISLHGTKHTHRVEWPPRRPGLRYTFVEAPGAVRGSPGFRALPAFEPMPRPVVPSGAGGRK